MRVLVTRQREQARPLVDALVERGFDVVVEPLIHTEPLSDEPIDVTGYDCVIVTSPNGARELARRMVGPASAIAAVGPGTAAALELEGLDVAFEANVHTQEGLVAELAARPGRKLFVAAEARGHISPRHSAPTSSPPTEPSSSPSGRCRLPISRC